MRKTRILLEGATYHTTSEINHGDMNLKHREIKILFLAVVKAAKAKYDFTISNFSIMDNHIHFLITPGKNQSLSKIMQWIKGAFAKKWNKIHQTKGHLWGERFYSRIIEHEEDLQRVSRYIDENPVQAGMVQKAEAWEFSGIYHRIQGIWEILTRKEEAMIACYPTPLPAG
jgi:putative transposase